MSTLRYLNKSFTPGEPHIVWTSTGSNPREVRKATFKARMLLGTYILQATRAAFNQTRNTQCPMCKEGEEDMVHFIAECPTLSPHRDHTMKMIMAIIPLVLQEHPLTGWSRELLTQLILDPTHPSIGAKIPMTTQCLLQIEKQSRLLCFKLHRARMVKMALIEQ